MRNEHSDLHRMQTDHRASVEAWTVAIREEEALAFNHPVAQVDRWERAHDETERARDKVKASKAHYEVALREKFFGFQFKAGVRRGTRRNGFKEIVMGTNVRVTRRTQGVAFDLEIDGAMVLAFASLPYLRSRHGELDGPAGWLQAYRRHEVEIDDDARSIALERGRRAIVLTADRASGDDPLPAISPAH